MTECMGLGEVLSAWLDGEADPAEEALVTTHLERCDACRARVALLRELDTAVAQPPVPPSPASKPCTTSTIIPTPTANASTVVMIGGMPALLGNPSVPGITDGVPTPCPTLMVMFPGQTLVMASR